MNVGTHSAFALDRNFGPPPAACGTAKTVTNQQTFPPEPYGTPGCQLPSNSALTISAVAIPDGKDFAGRPLMRLEVTRTPGTVTIFDQSYTIRAGSLDNYYGEHALCYEWTPGDGVCEKAPQIEYFNPETGAGGGGDSVPFCDPPCKLRFRPISPQEHWFRLRVPGTLVNKPSGYPFNYATYVEYIVNVPPSSDSEATFTVTELGHRNFRFDASKSKGTITAYRWDFDDGETKETTGPITEHQFKLPGKYTVKLRLVGPGGALSAAFEKEVVVAGIVVNSTADRPRLAGTTGCDTGEDVPGGVAECTLRAAIQSLNVGVADEIDFALPGGAGAIAPASDLPAVTRAGSLIDGLTQPTGEVVLSGKGIVVTGADHVTIRGLTIIGGDEGIRFSDSPDGLIVGNSIGVTVAGVVLGPFGGVVVERSPRLRIGGSGAERNVIGAKDFGVTIFPGSSDGIDSDDVVVRGNLIGIDGAGRTLDRSIAGIFAAARVGSGSARRLQIENNTIVGAETNVLLLGSLLDGATVRGNRLGVNPAGTTTIGPTRHNLRADEVPNLTVSDNDASGAKFDIVVAGSLQTSIVTTQNGQMHFEFREPVDGEPDRPREGVNALVSANRVGLVGPVPQDATGIALFAGVINATVEGNRVAGHGGDELAVFDAERAAVRGNTIGVDGTSTASVGVRVERSEKVTVSGNLIGALRIGVVLTGSPFGTPTKDVTLSDNVIGLGEDGVTAKPVTTGVLIESSASGIEIGPDNTFANGSQAGIATGSAGMKIFQNKIGLTRFGSTAAPNGIGINVNGGSADVHHNVIANSVTAGVNVALPDLPVTLRSNSIYATTAATSGIKGASAPPTVTGAARVTSGTSTRTWLVVTGLPTTGEGLIEVFGNPSCSDPEGKVPLFTRAPKPDRSTRVFNVIGRADLHGLTVTYTDASGKTSTFSACATPATMPDTDGDGVPDIVEAASPVQDVASSAGGASLVADNDEWVTLVVPTGFVITDFRLIDDPDPNGHPGKFFPFGFFEFTIGNVPLGQTVEALLVVPSTPVVRSWWKQGPPQPGAPSSLWDFVYVSDLTSSTGTLIDRANPDEQHIHLVMQDGGRGDEDFVANGFVRDPGAPSVCGDDDSLDSTACRLDSFRCYQAKPAKGSPKFAPIPGVRANGTFDDVLVDVKKPLQLCTPADTTADGIIDPQTHLEAYAIGLQKGQPKPAVQNGRHIVSQLGPMVVDTAKSAQLMVPTAEDPVTPQPALTIHQLDRFTCYPVKLAKGQPKLPKDLQLTVGDQFTDPPQRVRVKKLVRLCASTGANGAPAEHDALLLCVQVSAAKGRCADASPTNAGGACKGEPECGGSKGQTQLCVAQAKFVKQPGRNVANDLDAGTLDAAKADVLCLPAALVP